MSKRSPEDFMNVCDRELGIDDFYHVYDETDHLSAHWKKIAFSLHIKPDTISKIKADAKGDTTDCFQEVLECWLKKDYDYKRHGVPCWRKVCVAVKKAGDSALAEEIAQEHLATTGGATPPPLPAATGGATPPPLPATTGGATPPPLPATIGGATPPPLPATTGGAAPPPLPATTRKATPPPLPATTGGATPHPLPLPARVTQHTLYLPLKSNDSSDLNDGRDILELKKDIQDLTREFQGLFSETREATTPDQLPAIIRHFKENTALLICVTDVDSSFLEDKLDQITNTEDLFDFLRKNYVSWFNYEPMTTIVRKFLIEHRELREKWITYDKKVLQSLEKNIKFTPGNITSNTVFGSPDTSGKKEIIFKIERDNYTLRDLLVVQRQLANVMDISIEYFYFQSINRGCIELKYLIPDHFYLQLFPLNEKRLQSLSKLNREIITVTCGEFVHELPEGNAKSTCMSKRFKKITENGLEESHTGRDEQLHISKSERKLNRSSVYVDRSSSYFEENFLILKMIYKLQEDFVCAVRITSRFFDDKLCCHITDYIVMHSIDTIIPLKSIQEKKAIKREFEETKTIKELFIVLFNYLSWFKYQIILELIDKYADKNHALKKTWSDYEKKLEDYFESSISINDDIITIQVDRDDYTEDDLHFFRKALPEKFKEGLSKPKRELCLRYIAGCNPHYVPLHEINFPNVNRISELRDEFDDALRLTMNSMDFLQIQHIIDYILMHVHALIGPVKKNNPATAQAIREELCNVQSIKDLFIILQLKYTCISWFNYDLIIKLVRVFLSKNKSLKRTWSAYKEKLKDYFINWGGLLRDVDAASYGITDAPGTRIMIAKVESNDYTLKDLFFFRRTIPKEIDIPHYNIFFQFVTPA